ncbi:hypothetical protein ACFU99_29975 [Streptomyces sp. NPDC057654]|uniref:hypothetical protein n=1 Tax=Streptomyces sp. NPDC057654 TaxID=3346196 RepID=UPI00368CE3C0
MPDMNGLTGYPGFTELLAVSKGHESPGMLMPTILLVTIAGVALIGWFVLRGYGNKD